MHGKAVPNSRQQDQVLQLENLQLRFRRVGECKAGYYPVRHPVTAGDDIG